MGKHPTLAFPSIRQMKEKWPVANASFPFLISFESAFDPFNLVPSPISNHKSTQRSLF